MTGEGWGGQKEKEEGEMRDKGGEAGWVGRNFLLFTVGPLPQK